MPKRALIESRPWLVAGIALAIAFWLVADGALGGTFKIALKGASVAALAGYALSRSRTRDARLIAAVMATGASGDVALELSTIAGGAFFLLSHLIAVALYLSNRRPQPSATQKAAAVATGRLHLSPQLSGPVNALVSIVGASRPGWAR